MENLILYFFLIVLKILLNFGTNANYKQDKFSKTLLEKSLEFFLSKKNGIVTFNLNFILLPTEVNFVSKKQSHKKKALIICDIGRVKIVFALLTEVMALHMQASII